MAPHVARQLSATGAALSGTARLWRGIVPSTHLAREGRMTVTIGRRELLAALGGAAAACPLAARAQQPAMPVIGYLDSGSPEASQGILPSLPPGLADAGYIAGKTITIEARWANGQVERLPALAKDLVDRRVDIIVAAGAVGSARAAKAATSTIPIVIAGGADPVRYGLVDSLARPGGN